MTPEKFGIKGTAAPDDFVRLNPAAAPASGSWSERTMPTFVAERGGVGRRGFGCRRIAPRAAALCQLRARLFDVRLGACELGFGRVERGLILPGIDPEERFAFP